MRDLLAGPLVIAFLAAAACGDSRPPSNPPPSDIPTISGTERLGWDQTAATQAELQTFRYAIYVDGTRAVLADATCSTAVTAAGFQCSARLPSMTPGQHTLELAAFVTTSGVITESPRSAPFRVNVSPAITLPILPSSSRSASADAPAAAGSASTLVRVAASFDGFNDISDVAVAPDGRVFVAERRGAVRVIAGGVVDPRPVLLAGERIVSLALDPAFDSNGLVYALQSDALDQGTGAVRLVRYRDAGGSFGERAVIVENLRAPGEPPSGSVRVGPDGKLYVTSFFTPSDREGGSEGRLLRLEKDGTTPQDQPPGDPVYAAGFAAIQAFDWQPDAASIWIGDGSLEFDRLSMRGADPRRARQQTDGTEHRMTPGTRVAALRFYTGEAIPALRHRLLVAAESGLLSVRFDNQDPRRVSSIDTLLDVPMRAISAGPEALYAASDSTVFVLERGRTAERRR
jgi:glucose/arabinose dehydrogenase